jgi:predicted transcriptional regulator
MVSVLAENRLDNLLLWKGVQRGPLKLTPLIYKANLNHSILIEYLEFLNEQGLIE